jgi:hypothetical protein
MSKMLTSPDFGTNPKSFQLETADSYFIRETVAYVKGEPSMHADAVTVIVWFHGFYVNDRQTLFNDIAGKEVKLLANLKSCPIKELIFIAPFMGYVKPAVFDLDANKEKIPLRDEKGDIIPGAFKQHYPGSAQFQDAEDKLGKDADNYLAKVLEGLANFYTEKEYELTGGDGKPRAAFTIKNLILACHSGGGAAMQDFVRGLGSTNTAALKGTWCFDCLYGKGAAGFWFKRSKGAAPFYAYYEDTAMRAKELLKLMGHPEDDEFSAPGSSLNVIVGKSHYGTASEGFAERLKDVKL